jgi:hypothetical protein
LSKKKQSEKKKRPTQGVYTWLQSGRINPSIRGYKKLQKYLEDMERELIDLQGGPDKVTAGQEILIKGTIEAYGVILLASMYCKKEGILRPDKAKDGIIELQPVLGQQFLAFLNTTRQNLLALGLDRKEVDDAIDPLKYIQGDGLDDDQGEKGNK